MIDKEEFISCVSGLLESALRRDSEQAVDYYRWALGKVCGSVSQDEISSVLKELNHVLFEIECHGYFTDEEFSLVARLRNLQAS